MLQVSPDGSVSSRGSKSRSGVALVGYRDRRVDPEEGGNRNCYRARWKTMDGLAQTGSCVVIGTKTSPWWMSVRGEMEKKKV